MDPAQKRCRIAPMKLLITVITLLMSVLNVDAKPITCEEQVTLLIFFKLKALGTNKMVENGQKNSDPLNCDLIPPDEFQDLEKMRAEKLEFCEKEESNKETRSLSKFILDQTVTAFDESTCMKDFVDGKFSDLVRSSTNVSSAKALCAGYSPIHEDLHQRADYCRKIAEAKKDPKSCEIPDANGNCPGSEIGPQEAPESTIEPQNNALHWGKVKAKIQRR